MSIKSIYTFILLSLLAGECFSQDQSLEWFTYFGGPSNELGWNDLSFGTDGDLYIGGRVESDELLFGSGTHQDYYSGDMDAFLVHFSAEGQFVWSTYFGGSGVDLFDSMCAMDDGKIVIAGSTTSDDGIVFGEAYQEERGGNADLFLAAFNPDGSLEWSTYFGGAEVESGVIITCDSDGSILLAGRTYSQDLATSGAHDETFEPSIGQNPFVAKFSADGNLLWCTYFDANFVDFKEDITTDGFGNIYYSIDTDTNEGLATGDAYQTSGEENSVVLAKFSPDGSLIWSTYITGERDENFSLVSADTEGNVYITGQSSSETEIATPGAHLEENIPAQLFPGSGAADVFVMKFNSDGVKQWGTYLVGEYAPIEISNLEYTENGILLSYRSQFADNNIFGDDPFQSEVMGSSDVFITKLSEQGQMIWSTAFGGDASDYAGRLVVSENKFAMCGRTLSSEFYQDENSWQAVLNGPSDLYLALFQDNVLSTSSIERESPKLVIYPNPSVSGSMTLDWDIQAVDKVDLKVFDQFGRLVRSVYSYTKSSMLDLNLPSGLYIITFENDSMAYSKRFIVSK